MNGAASEASAAAEVAASWNEGKYADLDMAGLSSITDFHKDWGCLTARTASF